MARDVFDFPELAFHISKYLDNHALFNCVQVSKTWAEQFVPLLWYTFSVRDRSLDGFRFDGDSWENLPPPDLASYDKFHKSANQAIAKHGHYIREIVVEDPRPVRFLARHCSNLTKIICRFRCHPEDSAPSPLVYTTDILPVWELIRKSPQLHTLRLGRSEPGPFHEFPWISRRAKVECLQSLSNLRHLSVPLLDWDYCEFSTHFPRLLEARFNLDPLYFKEEEESDYHLHFDFLDETVTTVAERPKQAPQMTQSSLKQLLLNTESFHVDARGLQCLFRRFPSLERLLITHIHDHQTTGLFLDITMGPCTWIPCSVNLGEGTPCGPLLFTTCVGYYNDDTVASIVRVLPVPLREIHAEFIGRRAVKALVERGSQTLEVVSGRHGYFYYYRGPDDQPLEDLPETVGALLARCPRLRRVNTPQLEVHIRYLMNHPWVCCDHLEFLRCKVNGIPEMSAEETSLAQAVLERQEQDHHECLTDEERRVVEKQELIRHYHRALRDQLDKCPNLQYDFDDLLPPRIWR
ncbi:hypothetical protein DFQ26_007703 [Actinomortierella ambigua]|nr:hypothetical protein DFQ26_007703 [Actinomortierella ambigua]